MIKVVSIFRTAVPDGSPIAPYFSFIKLNPHLRLYYGHDAGLTLVPLFNSSRLGSG